MQILPDRAEGIDEAIKAPVTNTTLYSGVAAAVAAVAAAFPDAIEKVFGSQPSNAVKASILIALIAGWCLIAIADLFSRAIAQAAVDRSKGDSSASIPMPVAMKAKKGGNEVMVAAARVGLDGETKLLVVREGHAAEWVAQADVEFDLATPEPEPASASPVAGQGDAPTRSEILESVKKLRKAVKALT